MDREHKYEQLLYKSTNESTSSLLIQEVKAVLQEEGMTTTRFLKEFTEFLQELGFGPNDGFNLFMTILRDAEQELNRVNRTEEQEEIWNMIKCVDKQISILLDNANSASSQELLSLKPLVDPLVAHDLHDAKVSLGRLNLTTIENIENIDDLTFLVDNVVNLAKNSPDQVQITTNLLLQLAIQSPLSVEQFEALYPLIKLLNDEKLYKVATQHLGEELFEIIPSFSLENSAIYLYLLEKREDLKELVANKMIETLTNENSKDTLTIFALLMAEAGDLVPFLLEELMKSSTVSTKLINLIQREFPSLSEEHPELALSFSVISTKQATDSNILSAINLISSLDLSQLSGSRKGDAQQLTQNIINYIKATPRSSFLLRELLLNYPKFRELGVEGILFLNVSISEELISNNLLQLSDETIGREFDIQLESIKLVTGQITSSLVNNYRKLIAFESKTFESNTIAEQIGIELDDNIQNCSFQELISLAGLISDIFENLEDSFLTKEKLVDVLWDVSLTTQSELDELTKNYSFLNLKEELKLETADMLDTIDVTGTFPIQVPFSSTSREDTTFLSNIFWIGKIFNSNIEKFPALVENLNLTNVQGVDQLLSIGNCLDFYLERQFKNATTLQEKFIFFKKVFEADLGDFSEQCYTQLSGFMSDTFEMLYSIEEITMFFDFLASSEILKAKTTFEIKSWFIRTLANTVAQSFRKKREERYLDNSPKSKKYRAAVVSFMNTTGGARQLEDDTEIDPSVIVSRSLKRLLEMGEIFKGFYKNSTPKKK